MRINISNNYNYKMYIKKNQFLNYFIPKTLPFLVSLTSATANEGQPNGAPREDQGYED